MIYIKPNWTNPQSMRALQDMMQRYGMYLTDHGFGQNPDGSAITVEQMEASGALQQMGYANADAYRQQYGGSAFEFADPAMQEQFLRELPEMQQMYGGSQLFEHVGTGRQGEPQQVPANPTTPTGQNPLPGPAPGYPEQPTPNDQHPSQGYLDGEFTFHWQPGQTPEELAQFAQVNHLADNPGDWLGHVGEDGQILRNEDNSLMTGAQAAAAGLTIAGSKFKLKQHHTANYNLYQYLDQPQRDQLYSGGQQFAHTDMNGGALVGLNFGSMTAEERNAILEQLGIQQEAWKGHIGPYGQAITDTHGNYMTTEQMRAAGILGEDGLPSMSAFQLTPEMRQQLAENYGIYDYLDESGRQLIYGDPGFMRDVWKRFPISSNVANILNPNRVQAVGNTGQWEAGAISAQKLARLSAEERAELESYLSAGGQGIDSFLMRSQLSNAGMSGDVSRALATPSGLQTWWGNR